MIRNLWFVAKVALVVAIAYVLAMNPGSFTAQWFGYEVQAPVALLAVAFALVLVATVVVWRLWHALVAAPRRLRARRRERRRTEGYRALTKGMVALAAGDADAAMHHAKAARTRLDNPPLTLLLEAQAAALRGNDDAARQWFEQMLARPETEFLALRGLLSQAMKTDNLPEALRFARRAAELQPRARWVLEVLPQLEARCGQWSMAVDAYDRAERAHAIAPTEARSHMGALIVERSLEALERGDADAARADAKEALRLRPGFVPAVLRLAAAYAAKNRRRKAEAVLLHAWKRMPHPDLAQAWIQLDATAEPAQQLKRVQRLSDAAPGAGEARLALAAAQGAAGEWTAARDTVDLALSQQPSQRALMLAAELARHAPAGAAPSLPPSVPMTVAQRSLAADAAWTCDHCGGVALQWRALCGSCGQFDTLSWRSPTATVHSAPLLAMLAPSPAEPAAEPAVAVAPAPLPEAPAAAEPVSLVKPAPAAAPVAAEEEAPAPMAPTTAILPERSEDRARTIH